MVSTLRFLVAGALAATVVFFAVDARAAGGGHVFDGGTAAQQAQVQAALEASAFDWSLIPGTITVHIRRGIVSHARPGQVWLDAGLLDAGRFSWAVVQDEFAHQVDFFLFDDSIRTLLLDRLGGKDWCYGVQGLRHSDYGCERFSSTLVWAYWPSADNAYRPRSARDESAAMPPAQFRRLMQELIGAPDRIGERTAAATRSTAAAVPGAARPGGSSATMR